MGRVLVPWPHPSLAPPRAVIWFPGMGEESADGKIVIQVLQLQGHPMQADSKVPTHAPQGTGAFSRAAHVGLCVENAHQTLPKHAWRGHSSRPGHGTHRGCPGGREECRARAGGPWRKGCALPRREDWAAAGVGRALYLSHCLGTWLLGHSIPGRWEKSKGGSSCCLKQTEAGSSS